MITFIFGASGFAKEVEWLIYEINKKAKLKFEITNFVVSDDDYILGETVNEINVISESIYFSKYHKIEMHNCIIAVGSPKIREIIFTKIKSDKTLFPNLIHPSVSFDERYVKYSEGAIICAGSILTTNILIGNFVHINLDVTIGHDSFIGNFTTISPGVHVSGKVTIYSNCFIGTGANILEDLSIISNAIIGSGAVVTKSINEIGTYVGIPAKKIK
jgi:sugar O-acyltransferase (sialic acid O-acetyltransferase NeuD family)